MLSRLEEAVDCWLFHLLFFLLVFGFQEVVVGLVRLISASFLFNLIKLLDLLKADLIIAKCV